MGARWLPVNAKDEQKRARQSRYPRFSIACGSLTGRCWLPRYRGNEVDASLICVFFYLHV